jgi:hypothetical protein
MSELKYQDSKKAERLSPDEKTTTYEATAGFMRFSNGEEPLGKEPLVQHQASARVLRPAAHCHQPRHFPGSRRAAAQV